MSSTLFIRADAGPAIGIGHFMRMIALAEGWRAQGGEVLFGGEVTPALVPRALSIGARFVALDKRADDANAEWTIRHARLAHARLVVADGYQFGFDFQRAIRAAGFGLMVVDDNGENHAYDANWVLNLNLHANEAMYARRSSDCQLLLGTQYVLLRQSIRQSSGARPAATVASRVLVSFGGADPVNATGLVLDALDGISWAEVKVLVGAANPRVPPATAWRQVLVDVADVAPVMAWADVGICAPSTTCWELAALGVPTLGLILAENQVGIGHTLEAMRAMRLLGDARQAPERATLATAIADFLRNPGERSALVTTARGLSDGRGVERVIAALKGANREKGSQ